LLSKNVSSERWEFDSATWQGEADYRPALLLAATATETPVIGAALLGLSTLTKPGKKADPDIVVVVKQHLLSDDHRLAARALRLAKPALTGAGDPELLKEVVALAQTNAYQGGPERYEVLSTLSDLGAAQRRGAVEQLFISSLQAPQAEVVIKALQELHNPKVRSRPNKRIAEAALPLLSHGEPAVRGLAAMVVGQSGKQLPQSAPALLAALTDPNPFVRSQAANALALLEYRPALHALGPLMQDLEKNRIEVHGLSFERPARAVLSGSYWPHVAAAAQEAAQRLAPQELGLKLDQVAPKDVPGSLKRNGQAFKAWYAKNQAKLPQAEAEASKQAAKNDKAAAGSSPTSASSAPANSASTNSASPATRLTSGQK
jgi:hypothetical protein